MSKKHLTGRVIKGVGGVYTVSSDGEHYKCLYLINNSEPTSRR